MKSSFSTGFFIALFTMGLIQDYIGQEAYIQFLTEHWINIDWRWYLIPLIYLNVELFQNERYNRIIVSLLKQGKPIPEYFTFPKDPEEEQTYTDIKGNEYIFKNGIWKTTKNIKEELNKFNFDDDVIVKNTGSNPVEIIKSTPPKEET